jgi:predicted  nucleic acid-binding Zn-ribbon protein
MNQPFKLFRLQQIDTQLDRTHGRLQEIEAALKENKAVRQAQQRLEKIKGKLETEKKKLRRAEDEVKKQRIKIEQTEATLYSGKVRNPKELQDLQNEAAALKRYLSVLEDRQLEAMFSVEEVEDLLKEASSALDSVTAAFEQQYEQLTQEKAHLDNEVNRMNSERAAASGSIPDEYMTLYQQLRKQRRGIAVAKVTDKACSACGSTLTAALLHSARLPSKITRCSTCGRILYSG